MREIEAKFEGHSLADAEAVLALTELAGFALSESATTHQIDVYYDTKEAGLRAAGASLRVRRKGEQLLMTFKGDRQQLDEANGLRAVSRLEDEVELEPAFRAAWSPHAPMPLVDPASPLQRALAIGGSAELLPTAVIDTERRIHVFVGAGAELEVAVDRTRATRGIDGRVVEFGEIEIELRAGESEQLAQFCAALQEAVPGLHPSTDTKLGRALG